VFRAGDGVHAVWLEERAAASGLPTRLRLAANPYHWYTRRAEARLFASPRLAAVICNSRMVRDEIAGRFDVDPGRLRVIYSAVDARRFAPETACAGRAALRRRLGIGAQQTVFVLVGSGYERKGVGAAIRALARVPDAHLLVVGRESRPARYARLARHCGVGERVHLAGPQSDPLPWFGAADAFVLPTLYDPLPNAALEAMACALPIVTSTKSGAAELAQEWRCGLVCAAGDIEGLVRHMRVLCDSAVRAPMGKRARAGALTLEPARMVDELVALYRELLAARASKGDRAASL
jgi:UDP-glucose:(heptosyl)LPS alpha-1,3-glucosyltransferase